MAKVDENIKSIKEMMSELLEIEKEIDDAENAEHLIKLQTKYRTNNPNCMYCKWKNLEEHENSYRYNEKIVKLSCKVSGKYIDDDKVSITAKNCSDYTCTLWNNNYKIHKIKAKLNHIVGLFDWAIAIVVIASLFCAALFLVKLVINFIVWLL